MSTEELFENDYFIIIGNVSDKDKITDTIEECGGIYSKTLNKKTTLVICNDIDDENNKKELEKVKSDIKIIKEEFILDSLAATKRLNTDDYISKSKTAITTKSESDDSSTTALKKSPSVLGKRTKRIEDGIEIGQQWVGTLFYTTTLDAYPFICNILKRDDDEKVGISTVEGTFKWISLGDAETSFTAEINGDSIKINEHTLITPGNDQIELPNKYEAKIVSGAKLQIKGSVVYDNLEDQNNDDLKNTFSLTLNPNATNNTTSTTAATTVVTTTTTPSSTIQTSKLDLDYLVDGASFDGDFEIPYKFSLKITSRKNEKDIEGIIEWESLKTKTKFKGALENDMTVIINENEIITGDGIELPIIYKGKLTSTNNTNDMDLVSGNYSVNATPTGTFTLELIV